VLPRAFFSSVGGSSLLPPAFVVTPLFIATARIIAALVLATMCILSALVLASLSLAPGFIVRLSALVLVSLSSAPGVFFCSPAALVVSVAHEFARIVKSKSRMEASPFQARDGLQNLRNSAWLTRKPLIFLRTSLQREVLQTIPRQAGDQVRG